MSEYVKLLTMISSEFHKYLMENEETARTIPSNGLIIFQIEGENDFNQWHKELSLRNWEKDQPIRYVILKKWRKHSLIEELALAETTI